VPKLYLATTAEPVTDELVSLLLNGVQLHDEPAPIAARSCKRVGDRQIEIVLEQGKYHQVKRMLAAAGNHCAALQRTAIGTLTLDQLALEEGEWCFLGAEELARLISE
jgi:16S rRNA pseudouridine516 synthase